MNAVGHNRNIATLYTHADISDVLEPSHPTHINPPSMMMMGGRGFTHRGTTLIFSGSITTRFVHTVP